MECLEAPRNRTPPQSVENSSSTKLVPGANQVGAAVFQRGSTPGALMLVFKCFRCFVCVHTTCVLLVCVQRKAVC